MNIQQLECFVQVAEHLNFARAAEALNITQPAVSRQISSLESELNTRLFLLHHLQRIPHPTRKCFSGGRQGYSGQTLRCHRTDSKPLRREHPAAIHWLLQ